MFSQKNALGTIFENHVGLDFRFPHDFLRRPHPFSPQKTFLGGGRFLGQNQIFAPLGNSIGSPPIVVGRPGARSREVEEERATRVQATLRRVARNLASTSVHVAVSSGTQAQDHTKESSLLIMGPPEDRANMMKTKAKQSF